MVDGDGGLRLPDRVPDVLLEVAPDPIEVGEVVEAVCVADGRLEAPVERKPAQMAGERFIPAIERRRSPSA
jgi:hypothetical protein